MRSPHSMLAVPCAAALAVCAAATPCAARPTVLRGRPSNIVGSSSSSPAIARIYRAIRKRSVTIHRCYETALKSWPYLMVRVDVNVHVAASGKVTSATYRPPRRAVKRTKAHAKAMRALIACIVHAIKAWKLPAPGKAVVLALPFIMRTARPPPPVALLATNARGALLPGQIKKVALARLGAARFCYEAELRRAPRLRGRARLTLTISAAGRVAKATAHWVDMPASAGASLASCLRTAGSTWPFPASGGRSVATIKYAFGRSQPKAKPARGFLGRWRHGASKKK